ncbi:MAG: glycine cleavage system protein R [Verrucomicrobia bacterium]|nr:glycine cleavage system protein R [Verrucomicrobiota bacterium]
MQTPLVMTVIGKDRPGLVESIARAVSDSGGNWLESRMCRLGGDFAGILRVHIPSDRQAAFESALDSIRSTGLQILFKPDSGEPSASHAQETSIEIIGQDRPGIVRQITAALAGKGVNVEDLATELASAPMTGEPLFKARIRMRMPERCNLGDLKKELGTIASDLMMDLTFDQ